MAHEISPPLGRTDRKRLVGAFDHLVDRGAAGRQDDAGPQLAGHRKYLVLDELRFEFADHELFYWRDKQRHEMDFVLARRGTPPVAIECKWKAGGRAERNFRFFQKIYPEAKLLIVATDLREPRLIKHRGLVETGLDHLKTAVAMAAEA